MSYEKSTLLINTRTEQKRLEDAVRGGDLRGVEELIGSQPTDFVQNHNDLLKLLTQIACQEGHLEILRYFVEDHKVDINTTTADMPEWSFLHVPLGSSLLQLSIAHDRSHTRSLSDDDSPNTFACIEWLVYAGTKIYQENSLGDDALVTACEAKHLPAVAVLAWKLIRNWSEVRHGAAPWYEDKDTGAAWYPVVGPSRDVSHLGIYLPMRSG